MVFTTRVKTTQDRAFHYVSDLSKHPEWAMDQMTIEPVSAGPPAVGSIFKHSGTEPLLRGRLHHQTVSITDIEPYRKFGFDSNDGRIVVHHEFRFSGDADGTRIDRQVVWTRRPWWHTVLFPLLLRRPLAARYERTQTRLKERLEAGG